MKIALVTDTHLSPRDALLAENWRAVDRWIDAQGAELVVHLGDITADGVGDAAELVHARQLIARAGRDVLFLPGNHDIGDGPGDDGAVSHEGPVRPERLADFRRLFGPDFWSLDVEGWQLLGLNAQLFGAGGDEEGRQWAWLDEALARGAGPVGVFCHKPLALAEPAAARARTRYPIAPARAKLSARLARRDLRFVASGHVHQALGVVTDGVEHVWVPSCAFIMPDVVQAPVGEKRVGVVLLEIWPGGHRFSSGAPAGLVRHNLLDLTHIYPQVADWGTGGDGRP